MRHWRENIPVLHSWPEISESLTIFPVRATVPFLVICVLFGCSSSHRGEQDETASVRVEPTTVKDNVSLVDAVIGTIDTASGIHYIIEITIRTAVPVGERPNLAEPHQRLVVRPSYRLDDSGLVDRNDLRNKRLIDVVAKKAGDSLFGKISLAKDGTWYLIDTEAR